MEMEWQDYKKNIKDNHKILKHKNIQYSQGKITTNTLPKAVLPIKLPKAPANVPLRLLNDRNSVDKYFIRKLQQKKATIDIIIDLHGYSKEAAYNVFLQKFALSLQLKHKLILVITGKGKVLRESLVFWLKEPSIGHQVFYFCQVDPKNDGAFYLALKTQR